MKRVQLGIKVKPANIISREGGRILLCLKYEFLMKNLELLGRKILQQKNFYDTKQNSS